MLNQLLAKVDSIQEAQIPITQTELKIHGNGLPLDIQPMIHKLHVHLIVMTVATVLKCTLQQKVTLLKYKRHVKTFATGLFQSLDQNWFKLSCSDQLYYYIKN